MSKNKNNVKKERIFIYNCIGASERTSQPKRFLPRHWACFSARLLSAGLFLG
jgi:hypothetical protein